MKTQQWHKILTLFLLAGVLFGLAGAQPVAATRTPQADAPGSLSPQVSYPFKHDTSPPLRSIVAPAPTAEGAGEETPRFSFPKVEDAAVVKEAADAALQNAPAAANMPGLGFDFEGVDNRNGVLPPDTNGDIGPNHYVQWVNLSMAIWSLDRATQTATLVYGPANGNAIWQGFGGPCETTNDGDPIALYDHLADRWMISQFAFPNFPSGPYVECIAVSQTGDPTGSWYRYGFTVSNTKMNDYPKFGVWPDGYYMSINQFTGGSSWGGAGAVVYERDKMLLGQTARQVYFDLYSVNSSYGGMLPADLDGPPPPAGTPNFFAEVDDATWIGPNDAMRLWEFHVDWVNTANSTFGLSGNPNQTLPVAEFTPMSAGIPQPSTSVGLDNLGDRLMNRLQYRNYGTHESLITNMTVNASGRAGVRWYEVHRSGGAWSINQQSTYSGDTATSDHRWMGSAAADSAGNIAIGYSISSSSRYPSIAYTGRLASDPPNTMPQGEAIMFAGSGSQTHSAARWGDYSMLGVDPTDDCTFWYTNEYLQVTGTAPWRTRIGSFVFPTCLTGLKGTLTGSVTSGGDPVAGATVAADEFSTQTDASGNYTFPDILVGTYTMTVTAYGYQPAVTQDVVVEYATTTVEDFSLTPIPMITVNGVVSDSPGHGWPLYARIDIAAPGYADTLFTDPATGSYSTMLAQGVEHTFVIHAISPGYTPNNSLVTPLPVEMTQNFTLSVDATACAAPGYALSVSCDPVAGGLLVGNVYDLNTSAAVNDASVSRDGAPAETTLSFGTPEDPAVDDGLYILFSSQTGGQDFSATKANYGIHTQNVGMVPEAVSVRDFDLPAGRLVTAPTGLNESLGASEVITRVVIISNTGSLEATFNLSEVNAAETELLPTGPFADSTRHTSPKRLADLTGAAVYDYVPPQTNLLAGGGVLRSWNSGLASPWGVGLDPQTGAIWLSNPAVGGGDDLLHRFLADGAVTGQTIDTAATGAYFSADMAYNPFSRTFWLVNVSGGNCIVEFDPALSALTTRRICPPFDQSQRGLAYNPLNNSYYSGTWTNGILYHFDEKGVILDSANLNLNIAGLAFNPDTRHLFVLSSAAVGYDVYVLDTENSYAILGGFDIPGLGDFEQGGLAISCSGSLWTVNQATAMVLEVSSGESTACAYADVPWLTVAPVTGTLAIDGSQSLIFTIDAGLAPSGISNGRVVISNNTPYGSLNIPVDIDVEQYYAVALTPDSTAKDGAAGSQVLYTLQVSNVGNTSDLYAISVSGNAWTTNLPSQVGPLLPGGSSNINVTVSIPAAATPGESDSVTIQITSLSNPAVSTSVTLTTSTPQEQQDYLIYLPAITR